MVNFQEMFKTYKLYTPEEKDSMCKFIGTVREKEVYIQSYLAGQILQGDLIYTDTSGAFGKQEKLQSFPTEKKINTEIKVMRGMSTDQLKMFLYMCLSHDLASKIAFDKYLNQFLAIEYCTLLRKTVRKAT